MSVKIFFLFILISFLQIKSKNNISQITKCIQLYSKKINKKNVIPIKKYWKKIESEKNLIIDFENDMLIARSEPQKIKKLESFIKTFDKKKKRIEIELVLINTEENFNFEFGINWSGIYNRLKSIQLSQDKFNFIGLGGKLTDIPTPTSSVSRSLGNLYVNPYDWAINLIQNPAEGQGIVSQNTIYFPLVFGGYDLNTKRLNAVISSNLKSNNLQLVSKPKLICNDNGSIKILLGTSLPFYEGGGLSLTNLHGLSTPDPIAYLYRVLFQSSFYFQDIGLELKIKPKIKNLNKINIKIKAKISRLISGNTIYSGGGLFDEQEVALNEDPPVLEIIKFKQNVYVNNNETVLIAGFNKTRGTEKINKVPLLNEMKIIGKIFQDTLEEKQNKTIDMFITAKIIK